MSLKSVHFLVRPKRVGVGDFFSRGEDRWNRAIKGQKIRPR